MTIKYKVNHFDVQVTAKATAGELTISHLYHTRMKVSYLPSVFIVYGVNLSSRGSTVQGPGIHGRGVKSVQSAVKCVRTSLIAPTPRYCSHVISRVPRTLQFQYNFQTDFDT
jgi:hypothetical protein